MKRMTKKQFMEQYVWGVKNFMSHQQTKIYTNEIEFCPEHQLFEFKLPYKYPCIMLYNKSQDATILFFYCSGIINLDFCSDDKEGIAIALHGNHKDTILEELLKSKKFEDLLKEEYYKYEASIAASVENKETA